MNDHTLETIGQAIEGVNTRLDVLNGKVAATDKWKERTQGATAVIVVMTTIFLGVFSWSLLTTIQLQKDVARLQPDAIQQTVHQATVDALREVVLELEKNN